MARVHDASSALHHEAAAHHAAGRLAQAEALYRRLLTVDGDDAAALHGLGLIALAANQATTGLGLLERAVRLNAGNAEFWNKYGVALAMSGNLKAAEDALRQAATLDPRNADIRFNLGLVFFNSGANDEAIAAFARVISAQSRHVAAWLNKGIAHLRVGQHDDARRCLRRAHQLAPDDPDIAINYANVLKDTGTPEDALRGYQDVLNRDPHNVRAMFNLGVTLKDMGRLDDALQAYEAVLASDPDHLDAHTNISTIKLNKGRAEEALAHLDRVLRDRPDDPVALGNKATVLNELERPNEALAILNSVIARAPNDPKLAEIRANAIMALGELERADAAFSEILARAPGDPAATYGQALCKLRRRDFERGFELYENRWGPAATGFAERSFSIPEWTGPGQPGPVLIWWEQGIGDQILYAGFLPLLAAHGIAFAYECDARLLPLLRRSFPGSTFLPPPQPAFVPEGFAAHLAAGSLMHRLGPWHAGAAPRPGYLVSDPARRGALAAQPAVADGRLRIGISWRSARRIVGTHKSMPLELWGPILAGRDAVFVNLQYGDTDAEIAAAQAATGATIFTEPSVDRFSDIDGLVALIDTLDLVVTTSNVTAHLAGALGKPCWLALQHVPLWYWAFSGDVRHVYESVRVFRQPRLGDWQPVIAEIAAALTTRLATDA